jgi:hypothetical protein
MRSIFEPVFSFFGKRRFGQVLAATVIGAMLASLKFLGKPDILGGPFYLWLLGGAALGFTASVVLLWPRFLFGGILGAIGVLIALVPISHTDKSPVTLTEHSIKLGVAAVFLIPALVLIVTGVKKELRKITDEPVTPADCAQPGASSPAAPDGGALR